jgi:hypothetical protein
LVIDCFSHTLATELNAVGVVNDAIQDRIRQGGIVQVRMPLFDIEL